MSLIGYVHPLCSFLLTSAPQILSWSTFASIFVTVTAFLGKNWDVYIMTFLAVLVGLIYLIRQNR